MKTSKKKELSIIIPSYNEKNNLKFLLTKTNNILIKNKNIEIIIVDNGSTDGSKDYLKQKKKIFSKLKIVRVNKNIGYGYGIKHGLKFATGKIVAWSHADLQFDINDVVRFFNKNYNIIKKERIIVKGRRKNRSFLDIFFTIGMSLMVNIFFNVNIKDINGQPKMFSKIFLKKIFRYAPNDFSLDLFLMLLAAKNAFKINEFPLIVKKRLNDKAKGGGSLMGKIKLTIATLRYIFLLRLKFNKRLWKL